MSTSVVIFPFGQHILPITVLEGGLLVYEVEDHLIYPMRKRPVMPGIHDFQQCKTRDDIRRLAHNVVIFDNATEETEEEGDS